MMDNRQDSSEEDSQLNYFTSRLKEKWQSQLGPAEEMNLKQSLEKDSSKEAAEEKALGKKIGEEEKMPRIVLSKLKLGKSEKEKELETSHIKTERKTDLEENKEEQVPKLILKKLKIGGNEEHESKTTNAPKMKKDERTSNVKNQRKGLSSEDEEKEGDKTAGKRKVDKNKPKIISGKSNCLSSSGEEDAKTNRNSCKPGDDKHIKRKQDHTKDKTKAKEKKSKFVSSEDEEERESNNKRSKKSVTKKTDEDNLKGDSSKEEKNVNNKTNKSRDKDVSDKKQKKDIEKERKGGIKKDCKEDNKVNNKTNKSKDKDFSDKKQKKDIEQEGESGIKKDSKTESQEDKIKSKSTRKSNLEEDNLNDEECIKSKKRKLKKSIENEGNKKSEDDQKEDSKKKTKHCKENENRFVGLDSSDDEQIDTAVDENGKIGDNEKSTIDCQTKVKTQVQVGNPKCLSSEEEGDDIKNTLKRSKDKKTEQNQLKGDNSEEDTKVNNTKNKSKVKDVTDRKTKKDLKQEEKSSNEKDIKTETQENKSKSKSIRKTQAKEDSSENEESTKSKNIRIQKSKEMKGDEKSRDNVKIDTNTKSKNLKKDGNNSIFLESSDDEQIDTKVIANGESADDHRSSGDCQEKSKGSNTEVMKEVANGSNGVEDCTDFKLELQASSTENTNDIEMVQEKEKKSSNEQKKIRQDETKGNFGTKDEVVKKEKSKFIGLDSTSEEEATESKKMKSPKKRSVRKQKKPRNVLVLSSDDEEEGKLEEAVVIESSDEEDETNKKNDGDFTLKVESSAESSGSDILPQNKRKKKDSSDSDTSVIENNKSKTKKRRRIKLADSSDESGGSGDEKLDASLKDGESPAKGGRKNIKKIKKRGDLEQTTIEAAEEEKERRRRIEERQKLFNQVFEIKESAKLEKLVLDFDPDTKKELISVNKDLVAKMKPHQAKGVKFMWDSCFESVKQIKKTKGSGCILAHCMGLGKTFQVISLIHTLVTNEELTKVRTVMVVCPLSTVLNWVNEFGKWLEDVEGNDEIEVFHLTRYNKNPDRARELRRWQHNGGVLVMGYEMFRNLTNETTKKFKAKMKKDFLETLIDPGADLIVCDEGHMLKNEATALSKAMTRVRTLRRIVLTGTPMQNNLKEYHCMVQFVKPNLLGTSKEFLNRFVNPINNGQFVDSTDHDVKLMKRRAHVLHKMLEGLVQRFDYNVLTPFLPPKQEYVISVCLSELQEKLYSYYLDNNSQKAEGMKGGTRLFMDWQTLGRVWTHPRVLKMSTDKANWLREKKAMEQSDSEGSLRDFIDDSDESTTSVDSTDDDSSSDGSKNKKKKQVHKSRSTRSTRQSGNVTLLESSDEEKGKNDEEEGSEEPPNKGEWWCEFVEPKHFEDMRQSGKLLLLFAILKECELIEDKVLVFSQSLFSLDLIEYFLDKIDQATQEGQLDENLDNHQGTWSKGLDYFRLDGSTSSENRNIWCKAFNREDNPRARLFLISTRAGGLGINLTAANRVIIFDASWNPSHDVQSIFRIYRFGQRKPCYVYRFVAFGTMEEKVYERQVAKQSISNRVVDEQQVHRHFSMNDLAELYTFTPASKLEERPTPALPRDPLMAEILSQMKAWIEKYHEHDSLLENVVEEELNEEERKAAWEDFENDKKRGFMPPAGPQGPAMNPNAAWNQQIEIMRQQLKLRYANKSDEEINSILVYQVSILMRQQQQQQQQQMQMAAQMQAAGNMGYRPQMYGNNMMGGQMFNQRPQMQTTAYLRNIAPKPSSQQQKYSADQVYRMQQQANLARLQMQQMAQQQKSEQQQSATGLRSLLGAHLTGQTSTNYPTANLGAALNARANAELERMKQNYQSSREKKPGVTITEIIDKPSGSSET